MFEIDAICHEGGFLVSDINDHGPHVASACVLEKSKIGKLN